MLQFKHRSDDSSKDKLVWKWWKGEATSLDDFGHPIPTPPADPISYQICIYDETARTPSLVVDSHAPGGDTGCGRNDNRPCWKPLGRQGFRYRNPTPSQLGMQVATSQQVTVRKGANGEARISVGGKGKNLNLPPVPTPAPNVNCQDPTGRCLFNQDTKVIVQLQQVPPTPGVCWEAVYEAPAVKSTIDEFTDVYNVLHLGPTPPAPTATPTP